MIKQRALLGTIHGAPVFKLQDVQLCPLFPSTPALLASKVR
jgi:hypothetical protein